MWQTKRGARLSRSPRRSQPSSWLTDGSFLSADNSTSFYPDPDSRDQLLLPASQYGGPDSPESCWTRPIITQQGGEEEEEQKEERRRSRRRRGGGGGAEEEEGGLMPSSSVWGTDMIGHRGRYFSGISQTAAKLIVASLPANSVAIWEWADKVLYIR